MDERGESTDEKSFKTLKADDSPLAHDNNNKQGNERQIWDK